MEKKFIIISNNCWGAEVYKDFKLGYKTPFVGLFIPPEDFVKLCNNLPAYLACKLNFTNETNFLAFKELHGREKYPIGLLNDVEVHFLHYKDEDEAFQKWNRRLSRLDKDTTMWRVKGCDRDVSDVNTIASLWNSIPYKKVFFSAKDYSGIIDQNVYITECKNAKEVIDGKALYLVSKKYFDIEKWLIDGSIKMTFFNYIYQLYKSL